MTERYVSDNANKINSFNLEVKVITRTRRSSISHAIQPLSTIFFSLAKEALAAVSK